MRRPLNGINSIHRTRMIDVIEVGGESACIFDELSWQMIPRTNSIRNSFISHSPFHMTRGKWYTPDVFVLFQFVFRLHVQPHVFFLNLASHFNSRRLTSSSKRREIASLDTVVVVFKNAWNSCLQIGYWRLHCLHFDWFLRAERREHPFSCETAQPFFGMHNKQISSWLFIFLSSSSSYFSEML